MSELDKVLDTVMRLKEDIIEKSSSSEDKNEVMDALKEQKRQRIINEIKEEYKQQVMQEADIEMKKELNRQKITELKNLMTEGFFLAFLVGLAVNQATDLISVAKEKWFADCYVLVTLIALAVLIGICLCTYIYTFFKKVYALIIDKDITKKE